MPVGAPDAGTRPYALWSDYQAVARRQAVLIVLVIVGGLAAGIVGSVVAPKTWAATASVLVRPTGVGVNNPGGNRAPAGVDLDSEAQLALSSAVLDRVRAKIGNVADLSNRLDISVPPNSGILRFTYWDDSASGSASGANAFAAAYLDDRKSRAEQDLAKLVATRRQSLDQLQAQLKAQPAAPSGAVNGRSEVLRRLIAVETRTLDALAATRIAPGAPLDPATPPQHPIDPDRGVWIASGFSAGLLLAIVLAAVRDRFSVHVRRPSEISRVHGLAVLGALPGHALEDERLGAFAFAHAAVELAVAAPPGERLFTVSGTTSDAPVAAVAAGLAAALAHAGNEVLLVFPTSADDSLARSLGAGSPGFSAVVLDNETAAGTARPVPGVTGLRILGPGAQAADAVERFVDPDDPAVDELRSGVDYVVIAAGSAHLAPEAAPLASRADGTVLAVPLRHTTHGALRRALRRLSRGRVLGVITCAPRTPAPRLITRSPALTSS